jgi:hypothetical protein
MDKRKLLENHFQYKIKHHHVSNDRLSCTKNGHIDIENKYINLKYFACDKDILCEEDLTQYINLEFIPWKKEDGVIFIVTSKVTDELFLFLKRKYKTGFRLYTSSQKSLILAIQRNFSAKILNQTINSLRVENKKFSAHYLFDKKQN